MAIVDLNLSLPSKDVIELTVIGTGGGYGESIVVHLGNGKWMVVDCCIDPFTKQCLPLEYLKSIEVDIEKDVDLIICTHWHDDHIGGISELFEVCTSSKFGVAISTDRKKFLRFVGLDDAKINDNITIKSTEEINKCLDIINKRSISPLAICENKLLFSLREGNLSSEVYALSPSDSILHAFNLEIASLISEFGNSNKRLIKKTPNEKSVALFIKVNNHRVILGSDLEVGENDEEGWKRIINSGTSCIDNKSSLIKIPHHGSQNGYATEMWEKLLIEGPIGSLTPWNRGRRLPRKEMVAEYYSKTNLLYITSISERNKMIKRDPSISKAIKKFNPTLTEIKYSFGIIRHRIKINGEVNAWETELFGASTKISNESIRLFK